MSWKRKQSDTHKALRQSGLFKQRVEQLKVGYKRKAKHKGKDYVNAD